jgi:hypothetical protein
MARTQSKGWFRTRQQTKSEVVYFCHYSEDPATGARKEKLNKLGPVSQFPDEASRWQEVGRLGLTSFIDNPISEVTFEGLVKLYIDSGAISLVAEASRARPISTRRQSRLGCSIQSKNGTRAESSSLATSISAEIRSSVGDSIT